jgi:chromate transport protein ChrA
MTEEVLGLLLIILAVLIMLGIEFKRKIVKRPHFYWVIACAILAVLSTLLVRSQSIYLIVSGAFLNLIFFSLFVGILIVGTARDKNLYMMTRHPRTI